MECGTCTACCRIPDMEWVDSPAGELCKHCNEGKNCKIWGEHPKECEEYFCMWVQQEKVSMDLRPDKCGVIFDRIADDIIMGKIDPRIGTLQDTAKKQIRYLTNEGFSIVMTHRDIRKPFIYGGKGRQEKEVWAKVLKIRSEWLHTQQTCRQ